MNTVQQFDLNIEIEHAEEGGYAAFCVELGTASCGDTYEEALRNIKEAVLLHLEVLDDMGKRESVFREKGIETRTTSIPGNTGSKTEVEPERMVGSMRVLVHA